MNTRPPTDLGTLAEPLRALARARYRARDEAYRAALVTPWFLLYTLGSAGTLWLSLAVLIPVAAVGPAMWVARTVAPWLRSHLCTPGARVRFPEAPDGSARGAA